MHRFISITLEDPFNPYHLNPYFLNPYPFNLHPIGSEGPGNDKCIDLSPPPSTATPIQQLTGEVCTVASQDTACSGFDLCGKTYDYTYMYTYIQIRIFMYLYLYMYIYVCIYTYLYKYIWIYLYINLTPTPYPLNHRY
jgi:hypothetical protein